MLSYLKTDWFLVDLAVLVAFAVACHISQSIMDTLVAHRFRDGMREDPETARGGKIDAPATCQSCR